MKNKSGTKILIVFFKGTEQIRSLKNDLSLLLASFGFMKFVLNPGTTILFEDITLETNNFSQDLPVNSIEKTLQYFDNASTNNLFLFDAEESKYSSAEVINKIFFFNLK